MIRIAFFRLLRMTFGTTHCGGRFAASTTAVAGDDTEAVPAEFDAVTRNRIPEPMSLRASR